MNISKREKYLIGILAAVLICFAYYQFIYLKQVEKVNNKKAEKNQIEARYNEVMNAIANLDSLEEELKILRQMYLVNLKSYIRLLCKKK